MTTPQAFIEAVIHQYQHAVQNTSGLISRNYQVGDYTICLQFAGSALVPRITPALEHLSIESCRHPALTIYLWDSASTYTPMVPRPWNDDAFWVRGEVKAFSNGVIQTTFQPDRNALSILNLAQNTSVYWVQDAREIPYFETGAPLLPLFSGWFASAGMQLMHSAALGLPQGGVILAGKGGSGKSTTALLSLQSPLRYAADDYCILKPGKPPVVYSLYASGKVDTDQVENFSFLEQTLYNADHLDQEKALFILTRRFPEKIIRDFPLKAILVPQISSDGSTFLEPIAHSEALKALAPSTIFQLPYQNTDALRRMKTIIAQIPCYRLHLGKEPEQINTVILALLEQMQ